MPGLSIVLALAACSAVLSAPAVAHLRAGAGSTGDSPSAAGNGTSSEEGPERLAGSGRAVAHAAERSSEARSRLSVGKRQRSRSGSHGRRGRTSALWRAAAASLGADAARKLRAVAALRDRTAPSMAGANCYAAHPCTSRLLS